MEQLRIQIPHLHKKTGRKIVRCLVIGKMDMEEDGELIHAMEENAVSFTEKMIPR